LNRRLTVTTVAAGVPGPPEHGFPIWLGSSPGRIADYGSRVTVATLLSPIAWSEWIPLRAAPTDERIASRAAGLYRIRRLRSDGIDYVGQTGTGSMTLRRRLSMLRGVYADVMPYNDPHTAGPGLWALRHAAGVDFEVSVLPVEGSTPWRKSLECCAISLYRVERGLSPTLNFGRMPVGYLKSSGNNRRLVEAGRRFRGGPIEVDAVVPLDASLAPAGRLDGDSDACDFGGHAWSPWRSVDVSARAAGADVGLYRVRRAVDGAIVYFGQGAITGRLRTHAAKAAGGHRQAEAFAGFLEASFVAGAWTAPQRLELENDLIAGHVLVHGAPPPAQFLG
jgi:hypothetical protein